MVRVATSYEGSPAYDVMIEDGLLDAAGAPVAEACAAHRYAVVSDESVARLHAGRLLTALEAEGLEAQLIRFPAGEQNKTRRRWIELTDTMLDSGFGRDAAVLALGGGVVGDLAGFVAATFLRGVPYVQIPTTLLAMVDSSVGGKTGVDTPAGKNLVGAFHQPRLVLVDPGTLSTLPRRHLVSGLMEAFKHGLILDREYYVGIESGLDAILARDAETLGPLVRRSVEIKASVVARDTREAGYRRILNFGHTIGHALEAASHYELLHGEAVGAGMFYEAALGERLGVTETGLAERIGATLQRAGLEALPAARELDEARFLDALRRDKKGEGGKTRYTLLAEAGRVAGSVESGWTHAVDEEAVRRLVFEGDRGLTAGP